MSVHYLSYVLFPRKVRSWLASKTAEARPFAVFLRNRGTKSGSGSATGPAAVVPPGLGRLARKIYRKASLRGGSTREGSLGPAPSTMLSFCRRHTMNARSWKSLYPFASHELRIDGLRYHYLDEGSGSPLLMVHGNPTWSFYWRHLILAFRDRYRIVVPDHIGCGLSDKPQRYSYRLATHVANLRRLIETLDLRGITLLAHDWGGAIGLGAAVEMPERFARLVLFNTAAFRSTRCPWRIRLCRTPLVGELAVRGLNVFARSALFMATNRPGGLPPEVRAGLIAPYDSWEHRIATHRFVADIPLAPAHPSYSSLLHIEQNLGKLAQLPIALVWGMRDWCFTPHFLERFRQFFPEAEVHGLADAGHYVVEDAPEQVERIVRDFLSAHADQSVDSARQAIQPEVNP